MNLIPAKPVYIIETFQSAVAAVNSGLRLEQPIGFAYGERWQISPNGDWSYPQVYLELPLLVKSNTNGRDDWSFSFLLLQNMPTGELQEVYTEMYGKTYELKNWVVFELKRLFKLGDKSVLVAVDALTLYDDFDDNCSGWRVELTLNTAAEVCLEYPPQELPGDEPLFIPEELW